MPEFDGVHDPEAFLDWIEAIERICEYKRYDERKRFKFAVHSLTEKASYWYERLKARRRMEGKQKIQSWEKLKKHLKRKFLPRDYEQELYFQRIKSQIVRRKQEERKRLILDTRDPPKPPMVEESNPHENIRASIDKIMSILKEYQEEVAAKKPPWREDEPQVDPIPHASLPNQPMLEDVKEDNEESMRAEFKYPMDGESLLPTSNMFVSPSMEEFTDQQVQMQAAPVLPSEEEPQEESGQVQPAPFTLNDLDLQQPKQNLRANSFQEGEIDAGARGPKYKANEVKRKLASIEGLRRETEPSMKKAHAPLSKLDELWYQNPP